MSVARKREAHIEGVEITAIQLLLHQRQALGEPLVVDNLPLPQVPQHVDHVRVVRLQQQVLVGGAGLLLCCNLTSTTFRFKIQKFQWISMGTIVV